jgi:hypothetical protein
MESDKDVLNEPQETELLRAYNNGEAECWLRGYSDGYHERAEYLPSEHAEAYLRGYLCGLRALKH